MTHPLLGRNFAITKDIETTKLYRSIKGSTCLCVYLKINTLTLLFLSFLNDRFSNSKFRQKKKKDLSLRFVLFYKLSLYIYIYSFRWIQKMLRDDRFQSPYEPEDDSLWLPAQMLHAMSSMLSQSDDTQTDMLKVSIFSIRNNKKIPHEINSNQLIIPSFSPPLFLIF